MTHPISIYIFFHQIGPQGRLGWVVTISVLIFLVPSPNPCNYPRGAKEVPEEQSSLPLWQEYIKKKNHHYDWQSFIVALFSHRGINTMKKRTVIRGCSHIMSYMSYYARTQWSPNQIQCDQIHDDYLGIEWKMVFSVSMLSELWRASAFKGGMSRLLCKGIFRIGYIEDKQKNIHINPKKKPWRVNVKI